MPNEMEFGESDICGAVPMPLKVRVCGEPEALSVIEMDALRLPVAEGVKVT